MSPEERRNKDKWMLMQIPTQGKRLTRSHSTKFLRCGHLPPEGYSLNLGAQYVPMPIRGPDGCIWPTKFTKVEYTDNPTVHSFRAGSPTPYSDHLYATPFFNMHQCPRYVNSDLFFLSVRYPYCEEVDQGIRMLGNQMVQAKVCQFRGIEHHITQLRVDLVDLEHCISTKQMERDQCIRRLEEVDTLQRIHEANNQNIAGAHVQVVKLIKDMQCGRSS
jgi:hypothetical protein